MLARLGISVRSGFGRVVPDPFAIAVLLTAAVMLTALAGGRAPLDLLRDWGRGSGLWKLLTFTMQMCAMLVLGTALAAAPAIRAGLSGLARRVSSPRALVALVALVSIVLSLLNWSLCLVGGALLAREAGREAARRGTSVHYPLLCAAGYAGMMTWHGGFSGSAPLKATTAAGMTEVLGPDLAARAGVIPLTESVLGSLNMVVTGGLLVLGPLLFYWLTPRAGDDPDAVACDRSSRVSAPAEVREPPSASAPRTWVERIEQSSAIVWLLALPMAAALGLTLAEHGVSRLDFDTVNLALWCGALVLHGRPARFLAACEDGVRGCTGIILQFPLYAGIMGVMAGAGLSAALSRSLSAVGGGAFAVMAFLSAGLLNLLIPSGGGQWAVQGPILVEGALSLGLPVSDVMMAMAYGDQWTNMLQPFWALPLLAITGVRARDIIGYTAIWMLAGGLWITGCLVWMV
ncbi:TIGR00366 family protein [Paraliomyxa miuraensis]|uniref:TIGR00366 family protein n=1 Tax=Paraliomyxa miuraensis TaxID=376150 RepID=UPI002255B42C|nr:TIGR00366 family protein [Paraliomyxa miuraensis]MCX4242871.1 TIGR00366 family protein [Paraliomyxa miuraensis]